MEHNKSECNATNIEGNGSSKLNDQRIKSIIEDTSAVNSFDPKHLAQFFYNLIEKSKIQKFIKSKTQFCTHCEGSCLQHAFGGFVSNFKKAYIFKVAIALLM